MKAVLLAVVAMAAVDPAAQCIIRATDGAAISIRSCVVGQARRLEPSKADPQDIATAAIANCRGVFSAAASQLNQCEPGLGGETFVKRMERSARERVVREVVEIRASRSSP